MLVLVIASTLAYMAMNYLQQRSLRLAMDKAAAGMQQISTAATSYYAVNYTWPANLPCLQGVGVGCSTAYLPPGTILDPLLIGAQPLIFAGNTNPAFPSWTTSSLLVVMPVQLHNASYSYYAATTLAGMLPLSFTMDSSLVPGSCTPASTLCYVVQTVPIPGQVLNNATSVNYAGLYHSGACVPVPTCPVTGTTKMQASILVTPVSITGANDAPTPSAACTYTNTTGCVVNAYPLSSFTATATAPKPATAGSGPPDCVTGVLSPCYSTLGPAGAPTFIADGKNYWRVCISIVTEKGPVNPAPSETVDPTSSIWGQVTGTVMAVTRCAIPGEQSGSDFTVWSQ